MRVLDEPIFWHLRFAEFELIDDNKSYILVIGLIKRDDNSEKEIPTYIRLYEHDKLVIGTWLKQLKCIEITHISSELQNKCIVLAEMSELRIKSMQVFI